MKFIFPKNYNFKNKVFGVFDYSTIIINLIWYFLIFIILHFLFISIQLKIFIFIFLCFPLFLFSIFGFQNENILNVLFYIIKFLLKPKLYLFLK